MTQIDKKTLYFIEGKGQTTADTERIAKIPGIVQVRNVDEIGDDFEESDYVTSSEGVTIPAAYDAVPRISPERPMELQITPAILSLDLSDIEHGDLRAIATFMNGDTDDVTDACDWTSDTPAVATVDAATGYVTPVAVGSVVITAEYSFDEVEAPVSATATVTIIE